MWKYEGGREREKKNKQTVNVIDLVIMAMADVFGTPHFYCGSMHSTLTGPNVIFSKHVQFGND